MRNSDIAELLARAAEHAKQPLQRALRRAARRSFLWPEEAEDVLARGQSLTDLAGIGPYLNKQIIDWLRHPPQDAGERSRWALRIGYDQFFTRRNFRYSEAGH